MKREKIVAALTEAYECTYRDYRTIMALGTQLLRDGKHETFHEVEWYANSKSSLMEGIALAASALGVGWEELIHSNGCKEEEV